MKSCILAAVALGITSYLRSSHELLNFDQPDNSGSFGTGKGCKKCKAFGQRKRWSVFTIIPLSGVDFFSDPAGAPATAKNR